MLKKCAECQFFLPQPAFSRTQWRKPASTLMRTCRACLQPVYQYLEAKRHQPVDIFHSLPDFMALALPDLETLNRRKRARQTGGSGSVIEAAH